MISEKDVRLLEFVARYAHGMPEDQAPEWMLPHHINELEEFGALAYKTCVPPGSEPEYPDGLSSIHLTAKGKYLLEEFNQARLDKAEQKAEKRAEDKIRVRERFSDKRREFLYFIAGLVLGWILGDIPFRGLIGWIGRVVVHR